MGGGPGKETLLQCQNLSEEKKMAAKLNKSVQDGQNFGLKEGENID